MQANTVSSFASLDEPSCETLPLILQGELGLGTFLTPRQKLQQRLPTPRLSVVPAPAKKTMAVACGFDVSDSQLGPFQALLVGPLVTYSALRDGFWGQRHSLGFFPMWTSVSTAEAARWVHEAWGLEAEVTSLFLSLSASKPQEEAAPAGLVLKGPGWRETPLQREVYLYTQKGCRLCSSRLTFQGSLSFSLGGGRNLGLSGLARQTLPRATSSVLMSLFLQRAEVACYAPGRCYDL